MLSPAATARSDDIVGVPVILAGGETWLLAYDGLHPGLRSIRDALYDDALLASEVDVEDLRNAAYSLLLWNYDLTEGEAFGLILCTPTPDLVEGVMRAMCLPPTRKTYSDWAESALRANGIDPASLPTPSIPHVLAQLVATGRAVDPAKYTDSGEAAARRNALLSFAAAQKRGEV